MAAIWVDGVLEFAPIEAQLRTAGKRIGAKGAAVVRRSTEEGASVARRLAAVDTGFMRSSVTTSFTGDGRSGAMEGEYGPEAHYAKFVEHGTSRMAPRPFVGPSLDAVAPGFIAACEAIGDPFD
ncbi:HK97-gp10 family putative phage morphogenesis protein [Micromonospora carbonacea]|uniref:Phage protein, HK97 gp10 family n=1 Tax=Micromonospora carbonacea TaxID=47853 RepID=A0A1C5AC26_9ACTN|nr:HK97-gp10 family putative phage morphogenesis protein [Micromonospora carbonacea]SCF42709.1 phage protein, HK97 gp10 family [Micromonospora carbonacea]